MRGGTTLFSKLSDAAGWVAAAGGLVAVLVITALALSPTYALGAGLLFVGLLAGAFLAIAVHELGHALAAWLVGWRVWIISVLGVVVRFGHAPRLSTRLSHDVGGYVLGTPPDDAHDTKWRSIVFTAGGPLASVLTGPLFIAWVATLPRDGWETATGAGVLGAMLAFGVASFWSALMTLWPLRGRGERPNDMMMILTTLFAPRESADARGVACAWGLFEYGVEPSAWPLWMHESIARSANGPWAAPPAGLLAFVSALDLGDEAAARAAAQRGALDFGATTRAFVSAFFDSDAQAAETQLAKAAPDPGLESLSVLRAFAEASILTLKGDAQGAARAVSAIASDLHSGPPQPFWDRLLQRLF
ncbi:MAG: M50 family metallopeptidase [Phycisphaerales bacterium]|nr:M50 family metallopeptidase [Hyphomonadaceae bacterium]